MYWTVCAIKYTLRNFDGVVPPCHPEEDGQDNHPQIPDAQPPRFWDDRNLAEELARLAIFPTVYIVYRTVRRKLNP